MVGIGAEIESILRADVSEEQVGNQLVKVVAAEMRIAICGEHFKDPVF